MEYSEQVLDHFYRPRNVGEVADPDGVGTVGDPDCGDFVRVTIRVRDEHITQLPRGDVERYLWGSGYADVYVEAARYGKKGGGKRHPDLAINRAINARSKPFLALSVVEAVARQGSPGVPPVLRAAIETSVRLARSN